VQGGYGKKIPKSLKLRRGRAVDSESQKPSDLHVVSCIGDSGVEAPKLCSKSSEIARRDIPTRSESFVVEDACKEILSSRRLGHWRIEREAL
jgi:hypothetical protein